MVKQKGILTILCFILIIWVGFYFVSRKNPPPEIDRRISAHAYKDAKTSIAKIRIKAFYVVPKNRVASIDPEWKIELGNALRSASEFHSAQFRGASEVAYEIFPDPVILTNADVFYDTTSTEGGNPQALLRIGEEIDRRIFKNDGDLYNAEFAKLNSDEYAVLGFLYEGVGASGGVIYDSPLESLKDIARETGYPETAIHLINISELVKGFFLINRNYLTKDALKASGPTILYHEFGHTLGLPDLYDTSDTPLSDDVMGEGRKKPLENNYLSQDLLVQMGLQL